MDHIDFVPTAGTQIEKFNGSGNLTGFKDTGEGGSVYRTIGVLAN